MGSVIIDGQIVDSGFLIALVVSIAAIYLILYILRSVGLFILAKKNGVKLSGLAFVPCVWIFTACKLIGKGRIFGTTFEKTAVWIAVVFTFSSLVPIVYNFLTYLPYIGYYLQGGSISFTYETTGLYLQTGSDFLDPLDTPTMAVILKILNFVGYLLRIAEIFITVTVYIALFKKFWPEHYILASVLSFFGLFPIFVFVIRNKKPVDYAEYIRNRFYGSGYTPYGRNGYNGNNDYNQNGNGGYNNGQEKQEDPFGEFSQKSDDPFSEFDDKK